MSLRTTNTRIIIALLEILTIFQLKYEYLFVSEIPSIIVLNYFEFDELIVVTSILPNYLDKRIKMKTDTGTNTNEITELVYSMLVLNFNYIEPITVNRLTL